MGRSISNLTPNFNTSSVIGNYVDIPLFEEVNYLKELNIITEERVGQILNKGI